MYHFEHFKEKDLQRILDFIGEYPFAFLTGSTLAGKQVATQVPVLLAERDGKRFLQAHIMRNTDHHRALIENQNALLVFTGPSCYVSASWYSDPHMGSTWNYMSVHIGGEIRFMSDEELVAFMRKLTLRFEQGNAQSATIFDNLPKQYTDSMLRAIVGIEIKAEQMEHVFKLSQNRDEKSYLNIMAKLEAQGGEGALIAGEMKKRYRELFDGEDKLAEVID